MSENFELLEIGQIEIMHDQVHNRLGDEADCGNLRMQHDSLAAELVKRGLSHDTEIICPESELAQKAPNYRRGFTDEICTQCAFGQLFPFCNLYKADYVRGDTCDSFRYFEVLELEPPHGFLMASGKQTAWATNKQLDKEVSQVRVIVSGGEVFGIAIFDDPAQVKTKDFDSEEWLEQHRVTQRERRQWWADSDIFYVYRLKNWYPYEGIKLYEDGKVVDEPKLSAKQWKQISRAKELPKQIILIDDALNITTDQQFIVDSELRDLFTKSATFKVDPVLKATFEVAELNYKSEFDGELVPIYSLALVRNPRMRVSKKNLIAEAVKEEKQEGETMPFAVRKRGAEFCVINTDTDESKGCHNTREEANAQLTALEINVEEGEASGHTDKPKKRKPKKKEYDYFYKTTEDGQVVYDRKEVDPLEIPEKPKKATFMDNLKSLGKSIQDFLKTAESEEKGVPLFVNEAGIAQKVGIAQKMVGDELWHIAWASNAFRDREKEIFSTQSLKQYVKQAQEKQDKGFFNLWHIGGTDFARKEWQDVFGRFLIEAGPYLPDKKGQLAKEFFKEFNNGHSEHAPEGWGCSIEYRYLPEERETSIYKNIWITRTSTLPKMAAANIWTETRQLARSKMAITDYSEDQIKLAVEAFKDEDFVKSLISEAELKTAELEKIGTAHKGDKENKSEPQEIQLNMEDLAAEVGKQFQMDLTPIAEAMTTMTDSLKSLEERLEKVEETKHVKDKTETPRFIFNMQRASEDKGTIVTDDDGLKNQKPNEAKSGSNDSWSQLFDK